jgi:peptidoglycan L-alanyl-D-glutamate endopeptidase CwlK
MAHKWGNRSKIYLKSTHFDLVRVLNLALSWSPVDFKITESHRSAERQKALFDQGRSKIDGFHKKGKHNYNPSKAVDIAICVPRKPKLAYDLCNLSMVAGFIIAAGKQLGVEIRWGGNWDGDGEILTDQSFDDLCHFELK